MNEDSLLNPVLIVAGPTASGKSDLSLRLAQALSGEIISCDSVQVYRGFDIGSAKVSPEERALVPHHLIDCAAPHEQYHAARFRDEALQIIEQIHRRNVLPVLAGGTTLYLSALLSGLSSYPESDPALRQKLQDMDTDARMVLLRQHDPERARALHPNDTLRIVRALEIAIQTGAPSRQTRPNPDSLRALVINLCIDTEVLAERIQRRTRTMLEQGLIEEVQHLLETVSDSAPPFGTVGYREALQFLRGELDRSEIEERITIATRQLAKRQRTFWRNEPPKREWNVRPVEGESPVVEQNDLPLPVKARTIRKGFTAFALTFEELSTRIATRLQEPFDRVEVWHVVLR